MPLRPLRLLWGGLACAATVAAVAYCWSDEHKQQANTDDQPPQSAPSASHAPSDAAASASASTDDTASAAASAPLQSVAPHSNPSLLCSACRALLTPSDVAASMTASADPCAAASAAAAAAAPAALDASTPAGTDVPAGAMGVSCTMSPTASTHSEDKAAVAKSCGEAESASASAAEPLSAAAVAAAPSSALPACLDPLLELFRQRSLPLPRIRMLATPESDLPEPYFGLLHHSLNMTPTLSRFWMDQEVRLRVLCKQEQRQPTEADPHGTLARWITLQVDQPVHVGCSAEVKERFLQQQQQSTHTGTDGSPATLATLATSTSATSAAPSTPAPVARSSTSTPASSSSRKSAAKPGRFYYADSVQQAESSAAISAPVSVAPCASSGIDVDTMRAVCDAAVAAHERALLGATAAAESESCVTALLPPQHASAVLAAKTAMDEAVAAYEAALMLAHEHADSPVASASASASATAPSAAAPSSTPSPSPSPPPPTLSSPRLVEFGSIRIRLSNLPPSLREHIWAGQVPFATLLLQHQPEPIRQIIRPQAFFAIEWDRTLTDLIGLTQQGSDDAQGSDEAPPSPPVVVYGRCNYIFSGEDKLICEVVEIMPPIQDMQSAQEDGDSAAQ